MYLYAYIVGHNGLIRSHQKTSLCHVVQHETMALQLPLRAMPFRAHHRYIMLSHAMPTLPSYSMLMESGGARTLAARSAPTTDTSASMQERSTRPSTRRPGLLTQHVCIIRS
jgi:hypothetical protein